MKITVYMYSWDHDAGFGSMAFSTEQERDAELRSCYLSFCESDAERDGYKHITDLVELSEKLYEDGVLDDEVRFTTDENEINVGMYVGPILV